MSFMDMQQRDMVRELIVKGGILRMHPDEIRQIVSELPYMGFPIWEACAHSEYLLSVVRLQEIDIQNKIAALLNSSL